MRTHLLAPTSWLLGLLALGACGAASTPPDELAEPTLVGISYTLKVDASLTRANVRACFDGPAPDRLIAPAPAAELLVDARSDDGAPLLRGDVLDLSRLAPGECARWEIDLARAAWGRDVVRRGGEALVPPGLLLWRPAGVIPARVRVELPPGLHASAPWLDDERDDGVESRDDSREPSELSTDALAVPGNLAFVRAEPLRFSESGTDVEVAIFDGSLAVTRDGIERWLRAAIRAVDTFGDGFPVERLHVVVIPSGPGWRPVAFGLVRRGGGPSVMLLVHDEIPEEALVRDWTATHELSHLAMPRMYEEDRWISEGLATYFQEILRARGGLISEDDAWAAIASGFERGRVVGSGRTLWREARDMMRTGAFRRVYWAGTAWALEADLALRRRGHTLDGVLAASRARWSTREVWHGRDLLAECDRLLGEPVLLPLAERYGAQEEFPDTDALLRSIGVSFGARDLELADDAPLAELRRAIVAPPTR
ncbi:MAG: hypothetical protein MUE69_02560 [Myxococcota bacterium]|jgi:hypothetical protein|nr:hypothetical protein [Myxococcota bacterium]